MKEYIDHRTGVLLTVADLREAYEKGEKGQTFPEYVSNLERFGKISGICYTTYERDEKGPLMVSHDTEEEARAYAEEKGLTYYERVGLSVDGFDRCAVCGRWAPSVAVDSKGVCDECSQ